MARGASNALLWIVGAGVVGTGLALAGGGGKLTGGGAKAKKATDEDLARLDAQLRSRGVRDFSARDLTANRVKGKLVHFIPPDKFYPNLVEAAELAQSVRDEWDSALVVSSAYRPQDGPKSRHHTAMAIDLDLPQGQRTTGNRDKLYMMMAARYLASRKNGRTGFGGMGFYTQPKGRLHIDVRKTPAFWTAAVVTPFFQRVRSA